MQKPLYGNFFPAAVNRPIVIGGVVLGACVLGLGVVLGSSSIFLTAAAATLALGTLAAVAIDAPIIWLVRVSFIASFFFKGDVNLFKVDEIEDPSGLNISLTLVLASILFISDLLDSERSRKVFPNIFTWLLIALFVIAAAAVLNAGPTSLGLFSLFSFAGTIFIAYVIASHFANPERIRLLVVCVAAGLLFTGSIAVSQYLLDFPTNLANLGTGSEDELLGTQSQLLSRVPAFLRTPTEMAWVVCALIPLVLATLALRVSRGRTGQVTFLSVCVMAGVGAAILSLARGSWIALGVAVTLIMLAGIFKSPSRERLNYVSSTGVALVIGLLVLAPFYGRIYDRLTGDDEGSAEIRYPMVENATRMIDDNPVFGVGLSGYRSYMTQYDDTGIFVSQVFPNPVHNIFAHITAETGIAGGVLFCLLILYGIYEGFRNGRSSDRLLAAVAIGAAIGLIAFVISGMKEPGSLGSARPPMRTLFLLLGTIMAISSIRRNRAATEGRL